MLIVTFRGGIAFYRKLLGWAAFAGLAWFYRGELQSAYHTVMGGDYKAGVRELATLVQLAMPVIALTFAWLAFLASSAIDAGRILLFLFALFVISAAVKMAFLI